MRKEESKLETQLLILGIPSVRGKEKDIDMERGKRLQKSETAREKRKQTQEVIDTLEKRKHADGKNLKKKYKKIRDKHHDGKL
tara:strand:+ start:169 stop:417 length:249 start_codon:yes stop_codon:yes gene_type:complete